MTSQHICWVIKKNCMKEWDTKNHASNGLQMTLEKQKAERLSRKHLDNPGEGWGGPEWNKRFTVDVEFIAHSNWVGRNDMERRGGIKTASEFWENSGNLTLIFCEYSSPAGSLLLTPLHLAVSTLNCRMIVGWAKNRQSFHDNQNPVLVSGLLEHGPTLDMTFCFEISRSVASIIGNTWKTSFASNRH